MGKNKKIFDEAEFISQILKLIRDKNDLMKCAEVLLNKSTLHENPDLIPSDTSPKEVDLRYLETKIVMIEREIQHIQCLIKCLAFLVAFDKSMASQSASDILVILLDISTKEKESVRKLREYVGDKIVANLKSTK